MDSTTNYSTNGVSENRQTLINRYMNLYRYTLHDYRNNENLARNKSLISNIISRKTFHIVNPLFRELSSYSVKIINAPLFWLTCLSYYSAHYNCSLHMLVISLHMLGENYERKIYYYAKKEIYQPSYYLDLVSYFLKYVCVCKLLVLDINVILKLVLIEQACVKHDAHKQQFYS